MGSDDNCHNLQKVNDAEGSAGEAGKAVAQSGMRKSIYCLCPTGDTPSSARLFDAIVSGCIRVIISDELELPFKGILDYWKVCPFNFLIALFVSLSDAVQSGSLLKFLRSVSPAQIKAMQMNLAKVSRHFLYSQPAQPMGLEDLIWRMTGKLHGQVQLGSLLKFLRSVSPAQIKAIQMNLAKVSRHFLYSHPAQPMGLEDLIWRMDDLTATRVQQCHQSQFTVQRIIETAGDNEALLFESLYVNDEI
ncbi:unnamed protein product [Ilex paraguariensis]|uniref:Exostosin GT47 domain-containing protein n=1 Tax=Ilex paraguariensis TaxID=185542 RepID=A0ABC8SZM2_9AQUA